MSVKNPFGLLENDRSRLVRVDEVLPGLECNCFCPGCGARLVAVTNVTTPYFRHHNPTVCTNAFETAIHLMAKEVLVETKKLMLPGLTVLPQKRLWRVGSHLPRETTLVQRKSYYFDDVRDEVPMEGRVPDIVMWKKGRRLLVEIVVTHKIDREKHKWIVENDYATVAVDLSWASYDISRDKIKRALLDGRMVDCTPRCNIVRWVHHPRLAQTQLEVNTAYLESLKSQPGSGPHAR